MLRVGGRVVPYFITKMIDAEKIKGWVCEALAANMFLVDVEVTPSNVIHVEVDSFDGLTIDQCITVSRFLESHLDRDAEDFELQVSSPGLGQAFKVREQYHKNIGRELDVVTRQKSEFRGTLVESGEKGIRLKISEKVRPEGERKKVLVTRELSIDFEDIKKAKVIISFK